MARRKKNMGQVGASAVSAEALFEQDLEIFRTEAEAALQFFYAFLAVHAAAGDAKAIFRLLNTAPLFWNTNLGALQTATFVTLGRIFDQDSAHNVGRLLKLAEDNPAIFSKAALGRRKTAASTNAHVWLADYLKAAYVPKPADFRRLRGYVSKQRKIFIAKYRDLRHKVFAHKEIADAGQVSALFAKTNIREMQRMLLFLFSLHGALLQLFDNGKKPVLRPRRMSVNLMLKRRPIKGGSSIHERMVQEAQAFLTTASKK